MKNPATSRVLLVAFIGCLIAILLYTLSLHQRPSLPSTKPLPIQPKHRGTVTLGFPGRLGNHMFQYAALYGIARRHNLRAVVQSGVDLQRIFYLGDGVTFTNETFNTEKMEKFTERQTMGYDPRLGKWPFKDGSTTILYSYLQSWKYFQEYKDDIRKHFTFRPHVKEKVAGILQKIAKKRPTKTWVGIHVRRGDRAKIADTRLPATGYFNRAMNFFREYFPNVTFILCSNGIDWCKKNVIPKNNDVIFIEGNPAEIDLALLSQLNHTITSIGSYGWWAAWLADGITTYFKDVAVPGQLYDKLLDSPTFFLPKWIGMGD